MGIENSCFDRDQTFGNSTDVPHLDQMNDKWHPGLRLLFIVGAATALWALLLWATGIV
jgi:hypothetical protein